MKTFNTAMLFTIHDNINIYVPILIKNNYFLRIGLFFRYNKIQISCIIIPFV